MQLNAFSSSEQAVLKTVAATLTLIDATPWHLSVHPYDARDTVLQSGNLDLIMAENDGESWIFTGDVAPDLADFWNNEQRAEASIDYDTEARIIATKLMEIIARYRVQVFTLKTRQADARQPEARRLAIQQGLRRAFTGLPGSDAYMNTPARFYTSPNNAATQLDVDINIPPMSDKFDSVDLVFRRFPVEHATAILAATRAILFPEG